MRGAAKRTREGSGCVVPFRLLRSANGPAHAAPQLDRNPLRPSDIERRSITRIRPMSAQGDAPATRYRSVFRDDLFAGKVAVVTGAGSGLGRCTAHELAALGASVALVGRKPEKLAKVADEIAAACPGIKTSQHSVDIREEAGVQAAIAEILKVHGSIDLLVNNAGGQFPAPAAAISLKGWEAVVKTNLTGGFIVAKRGLQPVDEAAHGGSGRQHHRRHLGRHADDGAFRRRPRRHAEPDRDRWRANGPPGRHPGERGRARLDRLERLRHLRRRHASAQHEDGCATVVPLQPFRQREPRSSAAHRVPALAGRGQLITGVLRAGRRRRAECAPYLAHAADAASSRERECDRRIRRLSISPGSLPKMLREPGQVPPAPARSKTFRSRLDPRAPAFAARRDAMLGAGRRTARASSSASVNASARAREPLFAQRRQLLPRDRLARPARSGRALARAVDAGRLAVRQPGS